MVTGGAGYVGSKLVPKLLEAGYPVRVFDKLVYGDFALAGVLDRIELIKGDVKKPPANLMKGIFGIIHLAGFSTEPTAYYSPRHTDLVNHIGTEKLALLAKGADAERFIFGSTASVYFTYNTPLRPSLSKETEKVNPISPYSISKYAAEELLMEVADRNFKPIIFRKGTIYGFSPKMRYDLVVNSFVKDAFSRKVIFVHSGGEIYRPMLDIEDAVTAYLAAMELPLDQIGARIFNVATKNWQIGELAEAIAKILRKHNLCQPKIDVQSSGITRNYLMNCSRFKKFFRLTPERSLEEAVLEIWRQLEGGHNFQDRRFYTDLWHKKFIS